MRLVIKNSIQLCLRTLVFSIDIVLRHSNYNNRIISIEGTFFGTPCTTLYNVIQDYATIYKVIRHYTTLYKTIKIMTLYKIIHDTILH
jgi:hypothetical protein